MKNLKLVFALLVLLGSTGIASAGVAVYVSPAPLPVTAAVAVPGFRVVYGMPGIYCWYGGHYYSRVAWDRFCRLHPYRYAYRYRHDYRRF